MKRKLLLGLVVLAVIGFAAAGIVSVRNTKDRLEFNKVQLNNRASEIKLEQLKSKELYNKLNDSSAKTEQQIQEYQKQLDESKKREQELEGQLQAKIDAKNKLAAAQQAAVNTVTGTAVAHAQAAPAASGCNTGNSYKDYIYMHESGCNPSAVNSIGCRGIGQACPGEKLPCGADFACQDAWFSNYAIQRYGSWAGAYEFWVAHRWW